jgi:hypothetical protein
LYARVYMSVTELPLLLAFVIFFFARYLEENGMDGPLEFGVLCFFFLSLVQIFTLVILLDDEISEMDSVHEL